MTAWLDKLVKILALGFDTPIEPERRAALLVATDLVARHRLSLARAYMRIERSMPDAYAYLETKRAAAGVASFLTEDGVGTIIDPRHADRYEGDRRARDAMLSCTVRPLARRRTHA